MQNILFMMKMSCAGVFGSLVLIGGIVGGLIDIDVASKKLDVEISNVTIDGVNINEDIIDKNQLNFVTKELKNVGDTSVLDYELTNKSMVYDANVSIKCTKNGNMSEYYVIDDVTPSLVKANSTEKGNLTVTLIKPVLKDSYEDFTCELNAIAIQDK